ncbi:peptidoglycan binding domain-containing protein [Streptomyces aquilus]|uniref:peptidoglycan binding domain-containing protein n=1 Tax=Streptomyces aquilus TaxID=2548456 RepID=UPI0036C2ED43
MSRETDTPSSGPNGHGGAAYPSGTPPYGTPMASDDGADAGRSGTQSEERKTETTLTTRIRINIPGSRPIPPVVVRTPVAEAEGTAGDTTAETPAPIAPAASGAAGNGPAEAPAEPAPSADEKTSDWFAPRKSGPAKGGQGGGGTNGAGLPGGSAPAPNGSGAAPGAPAGGAPGGAPGGASGGARPGAGRPGGVVGSMSVPGGSRSGATNGAGLPGATGGPVAPGHGGGTGSFDVTEALAAGPLGGGARPGAEARRDDLPYFADNGGAQNGQGPQNGHGPQNGQNGQAGQNGYGAQPGLPGGGQDDFNSSTGSHRFTPANDFNGPNDFGGTGGYGGPQGPAGPTGGPVTGDGPVVPPVGGPQGGPAGRGGHRRAGGPGGPGAPGMPNAATGLAGPGGPGAAPHGGPQGGPGRGPGGGLSDDTAILTPQKPAPEPGTPGYGTPPDNVSGHTVTSGIPVVPTTAQNSPFGPGAATDGPLPHTPPKLPEPVAQNVPASSSKKKAKKKGRSKLTLLVVGVVVIAGGAYGAGLLMNHSDVPKGTTVLGVDIGGGTRDDAVKKLNAAFDSRVNKALKLSVGGKTVSLEPDKAGLQFDMQATVSKAATSDYNPVSVIGSLFGQERVVEPEMPVDEEKLQAALEEASGGSGSVTEGTIKFESGKAVAVYGKPGKGIDVAKSIQAVEEAYRTQVESGNPDPVTVPTTTQQPAVSNAEVDRMMKEFAQPAMSRLVTVRTDAAHSIDFGPVSLPKILGFKAVGGKLVDTYDLKALKEAYGTRFDGVQIEGAQGKRGVLPQDVASALRKALRGKTTAERIGVIDTNPN